MQILPDALASADLRKLVPKHSCPTIKLRANDWSLAKMRSASASTDGMIPYLGLLFMGGP
jgi:hypothetical protein